MTSIKINRKKKYKNLVVAKPWGSEYIACENNTTATWLLKIKKNHKTSLHCHPKKKKLDLLFWMERLRLN